MRTSNKSEANTTRFGRASSITLNNPTFQADPLGSRPASAERRPAAGDFCFYKRGISGWDVFWHRLRAAGGGGEYLVIVE